MTGYAENRTPEEQAANLARLRKFNGMSPSQRCKEPSDLPLWARNAIIAHEMNGIPWKQIAKTFNRKPNSLARYATTPAAKKLLAGLRELADDEREMARAYLRSSVMGLTADYMFQIEVAKRAGLTGEVLKAYRDLLDRADMTGKQPGNNGSAIIQINIGNGASFTTDTPMGESASVKVLDAEILDDSAT